MPDTPSHAKAWDFELPDVNLLRNMNAHARDRHIKFLAGPHVYFVKGKRTLGAVTSLVHSFAQPFHAPGVIAKMMSGRNWPRPGYLRSSWGHEDVAALQSVPEASELLSLMMAHSRDEVAICSVAQRLSARHPQVAPLVARLSLSPEDIQRKWECNREEAARSGSWMHFLFEAGRI